MMFYCCGQFRIFKRFLKTSFVKINLILSVSVFKGQSSGSVVGYFQGWRKNFLLIYFNLYQ